MSEKDENKTVFPLSKVMDSIRKTLSNRYGSPFWVRAEMIRLNYYRQSGHCYPDLAEKKGGKIVAQARAILWKDDYLRNDARFRKMLGEPLKEGVTLLFLAKITFEPAHGLTLQILDINPEYTLGEMEREKRETIRQLREEDIFERNRSLALPLLPRRIAVISVETSRGYRDFLDKTAQSPYRFSHVLFPSLLQGDRVVASISEQLRRIRNATPVFDAVAIIRGGGGDIALAEYNNYLLAKEIALFPIPVLTGIGHATNETVVEMVACRNMVTPTGLADFLIRQCDEFAEAVRLAEQQIVTSSNRLVERERARLQTEAKLVCSLANSSLLLRRQELVQLRNAIPEKTARLLTDRSTWLDRTQLAIRGMDPAEILRRGYSLTLFGGRAVKDLSQVKKGSVLKTYVAGGCITSMVKSARKSRGAFLRTSKLRVRTSEPKK